MTYWLPWCQLTPCLIPYQTQRQPSYPSPVSPMKLSFSARPSLWDPFLCPFLIIMVWCLDPMTPACTPTLLSEPKKQTPMEVTTQLTQKYSEVQCIPAEICNRCCRQETISCIQDRQKVPSSVRNRGRPCHKRPLCTAVSLAKHIDCSHSWQQWT